MVVVVVVLEVEVVVKEVTVDMLEVVVHVEVVEVVIMALLLCDYSSKYVFAGHGVHVLSVEVQEVCEGIALWGGKCVFIIIQHTFTHTHTHHTPHTHTPHTHMHTQTDAHMLAHTNPHMHTCLHTHTHNVYLRNILVQYHHIMLT